MMMRVLLAFMTVLGQCPFAVFKVLANGFAGLCTLGAVLLAHERRRVVWVNLTLCFPKQSRTVRAWFLLQHIFLYIRTFLDRAWLWHASADCIQKRVQVQGLAHLHAAQNQAMQKPGNAVILLAPHFLGLDAAWSRLCLDEPLCTMYSNQKNVVLNAYILKGRSRLGNPILVSRQQGVRALLAAMKQRALYYLPDMDFGPRDSAFVTFFGVQAATVTALARIARITHARIVPVLAQYQNGSYVVHILPPLQGLSDLSDEAFTQAVNHHIETWVRQNPTQYLWLHKRFKTRPQGQPPLY